MSPGSLLWPVWHGAEENTSHAPRRNWLDRPVGSAQRAVAVSPGSAIFDATPQAVGDVRSEGHPGPSTRPEPPPLPRSRGAWHSPRARSRHAPHDTRYKRTSSKARVMVGTESGGGGHPGGAGAGQRMPAQDRG